jgi:hypothetical protein
VVDDAAPRVHESNWATRPGKWTADVWQPFERGKKQDGIVQIGRLVIQRSVTYLVTLYYQGREDQSEYEPNRCPAPNAHHCLIKNEDSFSNTSSVCRLEVRLLLKYNILPLPKHDQ